MATVELRFTALPEHVRTARLVAAAVARRAGVDESVLDEVRLAVGEACSRAVGLHRLHGLESPVRVSLTEDEKKFSIEVADEVPETGSPSAPGRHGEAAGHPAPVSDEAGEGDMGLAVISGLVDDFEVTAGGTGGTIRMSWPTAPPPLAT
ncbi:ATP-binding protein [Streptomyces thermolineatus]|uniref:ATP-binding protein n=1 Tax=Streptomyces thermolineatus TaxID=44033 RepID=A0ABP5YMW2_9ACTN